MNVEQFGFIESYMSMNVSLLLSSTRAKPVKNKIEQ